MPVVPNYLRYPPAGGESLKAKNARVDKIMELVRILPPTDHEETEEQERKREEKNIWKRRYYMKKDDEAYKKSKTVSSKVRLHKFRFIYLFI